MVQEKYNLMGYGWSAHVKDSEGNVIVYGSILGVNNKVPALLLGKASGSLEQGLIGKFLKHLTREFCHYQ